MLEAICFQTREVLDAMQADAAACDLHTSLLALRVDGGASTNDLLMQLQADILGKCVVRPVDVETTALGAALAAGVTLDLWSGDVLFAPHQPRKGAVEFAPKGSEEERATRYVRWKSAVSRSMCWTQAEPPVATFAAVREGAVSGMLHAAPARADWAQLVAGVALGAVVSAVIVARWRSLSASA